MKIKKGTLHFDYDGSGDVLYAYVDEPEAAASVEEDGVVFGINPHTKMLVGFTIVDYSRKLRDGLLKKIKYFDNITLPKVKEFA
jgi:hypothetical protein